MKQDDLRRSNSSIIPVLIALTGTLFSYSASCVADNVPATQPALDYKPGVDKVMSQLRDTSTRNSAERIIRGFPEPALPIVKDDLVNQLNDLPADVRADVAKLVDRNHAARAHAKELAEKQLSWNEASLKDAYQKVGDHDPAWDDDALAAMLSFVRTKPDLSLFDEASRAGCKDPMLRYCFARALQIANGGRYTRRFDEAADAMMSSDYPAFRKCFAQLYAVKADFPGAKSKTALTDDQAKQILKRLNSALALYTQVCGEPNVPPEFLFELADLLQDGYFKATGDRLKAINTVYPVVCAALPNSTVPLDFEGIVYIDLAWDARGDGGGDTVTADGANLMQQRLGTARDVLTQASEKDSFDFLAPTAMMKVVLGEGSGQAEIEKWFIKAIEANPDHLPAYRAKMYFLEPKWYGGPDQMLAFGHECLATQNFAAGIPMELASAHEALSRYSGASYNSKPQPQYFQDNADAWEDICAGFVPALALAPDDYHDRSLFARYALWCGQYDEANRQFKLLADHADLGVFGSQAQFNKLRNEANTQSASTQP